MADVAQLVRALVCGTRCRRFESDHPPHKKMFRKGHFFYAKADVGFEPIEVLEFKFF